MSNVGYIEDMFGLGANGDDVPTKNARKSNFSIKDAILGNLHRKSGYANQGFSSEFARKLKPKLNIDIATMAVNPFNLSSQLTNMSDAMKANSVKGTK